MSNSYLANPIIFLIDTLFFIFTLAVLLRFLLQWVRADFYNPVSRFIVKLTNPALIPLRKVIPGVKGIDLAAIVLLILLMLIKLALVYRIAGYSITATSLVPRAFAELIALFLNTYLVTIIVQALLSWFGPQQYNPVSVLLYQLNEPLLRPVRQILPAMEGFDFSPLVVIILIQLSKMIILPPLYAIG